MTDTTEVDEAAWDEAAAGIDVRVVRALRSEGVQRAHLARAAGFIKPETLADDNVNGLKLEAQYLRRDIPSLFGPAPDRPAGAPDRPGGQKSAVERGREMARELGWSKDSTPAQKRRI